MELIVKEFSLCYNAIIHLITKESNRFMNRLTDKAILLVLCLTCYAQYVVGSYAVAAILVAMAASALGTWMAEKPAVVLAVFLIYTVGCVAFPALILFLPLVIYDMLGTRWRWAALLALVPAAAHTGAFQPLIWLFTAAFAAMSLLIYLRSASLERVRADYIRLRDSSKELSMQFESKNRELMEKQDYEIHLATLGERNRIARDIHDNVGHVLSNAILQTGALLAGSKDDAMREKLNILKDTLSSGMDSIRASIHDLHDESVDLYAEARALSDGFKFCPVTLDYDISGNPDQKIKYALLAIAKEALSNVARHSNATEVRLAMLEHPALYQLVVRDNGTMKGSDGEGIGLRNIEERVNALGGILTIERDKGFTVFASIPKENNQ